MKSSASAKIFWSGGSQAVRLPKQFRFSGTEVVVRREGKTLVLEPMPQGTDWNGFWDELLPLKQPLRRAQPKRAEKRRPI